MRKITVIFPKLYRNGLFTVLAASWTTGIIFFILSRYITVPGDFGPEKHPWQYPVLQIHGAAAFFMMMAFGSIIATHIPMTWKLQRLRKLGLTMAAAIGLQIVSAYFLYYLANEDWRAWVANSHAALGVSLPLLLASHIVVGRRSRRTKPPK